MVVMLLLSRKVSFIDTVLLCVSLKAFLAVLTGLKTIEFLNLYTL